MASIRKLRGKYQVQVRRKGMNPVSKTFQRLQDAKEWARHIEVQADRQELEPCRKELETITLGQLVDRYRTEVTPTKKSHVVESAVLNAFLRHPICKKTLSNLTTEDFARYRDERLREIKPKTLKRSLCPVQNMFEIAKSEWGIPIKANPLSDLQIKFTDNRRERRLSEVEELRLIESAQTRKNPLIAKIILFALETAMRRGEILSICWGSVNLKHRSVTILEAKNGYSRIIPLTPKACAILQEIEKTDDKVFPITPNAFRLTWERVRTKAGLEDLHFHDLRHEAISRFFEIGLTVPEVAHISGHRDARMLFRYAHAQIKTINEKLDSWSRNSLRYD